MARIHHMHSIRAPLVSVLLVRFLATALMGGAAWVVHAQVIVNAYLESGTTGWNGCPLEINPASVYGGVGSNRVAEVDGDLNAGSTTDDMQLCQTISGFTIGSVYMLEFDAARRQGGPTPTTVSVNVQMDDALDATVTRTGTWNLVREYLQFTATATSHYLHITPNFTVSYGMLFDNFSINLVSALPVELLDFQARAEASAVLLTWATASEHNSATFGVERSTDGIQWTPIAQLPAAGSSQGQLDYATHDPQPVQGLAYYRLNQVDLDGTEHLYDATPVYFASDHELQLWPNPAAEDLFVQLPAEGTTVSVYNGSGQRMPVPLEQAGAAVHMDVGTLPAGTYIVRDGSGAAIGRFLKR